MSINRDSKKLHIAIGKTIATLRKVSVELSEHAVSVLWHLGQHRDPSVLNFLYGQLNKNMQAGFKRWVVAVSVEALRHGGYNEVELSTLPFRFSEKGGFTVVTTEKDKSSVTKTDMIAAFMVLNENTIGFGNFMDIDTDKEKDPFSILSITKVLRNLVNKTDKSDVENSVKLALAELVKSFEQKMTDKIDLAESAARISKNRTPVVEDRPAMVH